MSDKLPRWDGEVRPTTITILVWLGILFNLIYLIAGFFITPESRIALANDGVYFGPIAMLDSLLTIIAYIGIYRLKLWGLTLFIIVTVAYNAYDFLLRNSSLTNMVLDAALLIIVLCFVHKMR